VLSQSFGALAGTPDAVDLELRASWTPLSADLRPHGDAFCRLMASVVGLPPVGVTLFGRGATS
jgi:hypothetical protein